MFWPFNHYPGSDYETFNYDWIIGKLKELKDSVAAAKASEDDAAKSASDAQTSAGLAFTYRNQSKDYRDDAQGFANDAEASANSISGVVAQVGANTNRIDDIIANAGDGTIPSELVDVRTAFNAITYTTAGDAVRRQTGELYNSLKFVKFSNLEQGSIMGGFDSSSTTFLRTAEHYPVAKGDIIYMAPLSFNYRITFYLYDGDTDPTYRQASALQDVISGAAGCIYEVPQDGYIRFRANSYPDTSNIQNNQADFINSVFHIYDARDVETDHLTRVQSEICPETYFSDLEQGTIVDGQDSTSGSILRTSSFYKVRKGQTVYLKDLPFIYRLKFYMYNSESQTDYIGASELFEITSGNPDTYIVPVDCYLRFRVNSIPDSSYINTAVNTFKKCVYVYNVKLLEPVYDDLETLKTLYLDNEIETKVSEYATLFNNSEKTAAYIFFTDQHLMGTSNTFNTEAFNNYMDRFNEYVDVIPADFIVNGGDWLNSGDTGVNAKTKLAYVAGVLERMPVEVVNVIGNHDYNYLGDDLLNPQTVGNILNRKRGKNYFEFEQNGINYFTFDTYTDDVPAMNTYKWEQMDWFAQKLLDEDPANVTIFMHIYYQTGSTPSVMAGWLGRICYAFNNRGTVSLDSGGVYNFSGCTGHIDYMMAGHSHRDFTDMLTDNSNSGYTQNIPVIGVTQLRDSNALTFDMVYTDYTARIVHLVRVGTGTNRTVAF